MLWTHTHTQTISLQHHALYTYTHSNNQLTASCFVHIHTLKQSACIILVLRCTSLHKALTMCSMFWITRSASLSGVVFAVLMPLEPTNIRMRRHPLYVCTSRQTLASSVLYTPSYRLLWNIFPGKNSWACERASLQKWTTSFYFVINLK